MGERRRLGFALPGLRVDLDEAAAELEELASFVQRARAMERKVVPVVDESHLVVEHVIKPNLLIEVSATPRAERPDAPIVVLREDGIKEGLIRKGITVNPGAPLAANRPDVVLVHAAGVRIRRNPARVSRCNRRSARPARPCRAPRTMSHCSACNQA